VVTLDHLILTVTDRDAGDHFSTEVMGFGYEGEDGPFSVIRVGPDTTLQLAPRGTRGQHARPRASRTGKRGQAPTLSLFDPNGHLVELRHY
jgi:extradiol dioxygenase family protein